MTYYIGIDGGGTKTEGVLTDASGRLIARHTVGASNPNDVTLPVAADTVSNLARALLAALPKDASEVALFAGVAGAINHRDALREALAVRLADTPVNLLDVDSDARILLSSAIPEGDGACMICGTGSVCFLRIGTDIYRIGGWGYLLDSGGNGYSIGRDAIETVLRAHDGRGTATTLTARLAAHYGSPVQNLITDFYQRGKPYIASCTPCVFDAAEEDHDATALLILNRNARALAGYLNGAWNRMMEHCERTAAPLPDVFTVAMGGSINRNRPDWVRLVSSLVDGSIPAHITVVAYPPVIGAILEAARLSASQGSTPDFSTLRENLVGTFSRTDIG